MWSGGDRCENYQQNLLRSSLPSTVSGPLSKRVIPRSYIPSSRLLAQVDAAVSWLWLLTPLSAGTAVIVVMVAVTTNSWLHTVETFPNPSYNGSGEDFIIRETVSGLWKICETEVGAMDKVEFHCSDIRYFPLEQYTADHSDASTFIPYTVTRSAPPILFAVIGIVTGTLFCILGYTFKKRRVCTFIAGVMFILSGLLLLLGIIIYISIFKSEIGHKLRYIVTLDTPAVTYRYGYSFCLLVSGFVGIECAGTSAIFLFLRLYQKDWLQELAMLAKQECMFWDKDYSLVEAENSKMSLRERRLLKRDTYPSSSRSFDRRNLVNINEFHAVPHCSIHSKKRITTSRSLKDLTSSTLYGFPPPIAPHPTACDSYMDDIKEPPQSANTLSGMRSSIFQSQNSLASGKFLKSEVQSIQRDEELTTFPGVSGTVTPQQRLMNIETNSPYPLHLATIRRDRGGPSGVNRKRTTPV